jgi:hypothetical protein
MTSQAIHSQTSIAEHTKQGKMCDLSHNDGDPPKLFTGSRVDALEVLGKSGYRQQVAMAAFTDINNYRCQEKKAPATFGRKGQQTAAVEGRAG